MTPAVLNQVEQALAFYADEAFWSDGGFDFIGSENKVNTVELVLSTMDHDRGKLAREALSALRAARKEG